MLSPFYSSSLHTHTQKEEAHCQLGQRGEEDDGRLPGGLGLLGVPAGPRYISASAPADSAVSLTGMSPHV